LIDKGREQCKKLFPEILYILHWTVYLFSKKQRNLKQEVDTCTMNLKSSQSMFEFYKTKNPDVEPGCVFGEWSDWGSCEAGKKIRRRAKLASECEECEVDETETEEGCTEVSMEVIFVILITLLLPVFFKQQTGGPRQCCIHFRRKVEQ
jgi:hypothetical protein